MIDKNEAPEGFEAVEDKGCENCCFVSQPSINCFFINFQFETRKDGHDVIFVKKNDIQAP